MSVDERLRTGLAVQEAIVVPTGAAYATVVEGARRRRFTRRVTLAAAVALVAGGVGVGALADSASERSGPTMPAPPDDGVAPSELVGRTGRSPTQLLEGGWDSGWVPLSTIEEAVRTSGDGAWVDELRARIPGERVRIGLLFDKGYVVALADYADGTGAVVDNRLARIDGDRLIMTYEGGREDLFMNGRNAGGTGVTTFRWTTEGDVLSLRMVSARGDEGLPGEVWQRAIYTAVEFEKG